MALRKSSVLLPSVFQTTKNEKFLNATVDQLISEPVQQRINGFVGRKFAPNYTSGDSYISEIDSDRQNYQLEPAVVYRDATKNIESLTSYLDFVNVLKYNGVDTTAHSDLFEQEYYNYSSFVDFDKLVNYGEYFWLPAGPDSVQVFNSVVDTQVDFTIVKNYSNYKFNDDDNLNPTLYLARGGNYTFTVNQSGEPFWIQTDIGLSGVSDHSRNISTREIAGVTNNGDDVGTITFNVPAVDSQNDLIQATQSISPDLATTLTWKQIHNVTYTDFIANYPNGIDGLTELDGKKIVFINTSDVETDWQQASDSSDIYDISVRYDVYNISIESGVIKLNRVADWPNLTKAKIKQGTDYGNREFYKNAESYPEIIPPYTAQLDRLYYQSGSDVNNFGTIEIVNAEAKPNINITRDILGKQNFTSNNGVMFTNGLKIQLNGDVTPESYANTEYYVEGVGQTGGIVLVAVDDLVTPETYTVTTSEGFDSISYDVGGWDGTLNSPTQQDYILINRASPDLNAWSRTNRWFHRSVIQATAGYNNYIVEIDETARAKRPIIEFKAGLELYNMGTSAKSPVTVVDTLETDALSNVNGSIGHYSDGVQLQDGKTVIFSADSDADVAKTIYRIDFINEDDNTSTDEIINLVAIGTVEAGDCVLSTLGVNNQGKQFFWNGTAWKLAQSKTSLNQDPLFDVNDPDHVSFDDSTKYPSSTFVGSKLFSYKRNASGAPDSVLLFGLTYKNFNSIGDIVFENNFDTDKFQYTKSTGNVDVIIRSGHAHTFDSDGNRTLENGWTKVVEASVQNQIVNYNVGNELYSFEIGASVDTTRTVQPLEVFVNGKFISPSNYTHLVQSDREYIVFSTALVKDDVVVIKFYSKTKSPFSYYEVPLNLENNASNATFETLTLGQVRNHTIETSHQIKTFVGETPGDSNLRDLDYKKYPGKILQHSAGMTLPMYLLANKENGTIDSIRYVKDEYNKFKNRLIDNVDKLDIDLTNPSTSLDKILSTMVGQKTSVFPFYYSDMTAWGDQKSLTTHSIDDVTQFEFEFTTPFDLTTISNRAVLVYHTVTQTGTKNLLIEGLDYTFDTVEAKVALTLNNLGTSNIGIAVGDTITLCEYTDTNGSFVPPTPTKMGLYPKYLPKKYVDNTYVTDKTVIRGHDGSTWVAWGDIRDDVILEFEKRVYNNLKTQYNSNIFDIADVIPGYFRNTQNDFIEVNNIIRRYFGEWAKRNKLEVSPNTTYDATNAFTWNYRNSVNVLNGEKMPGGWRGIYNWFYDTDTPHTTPWEMLGLGEKPLWWDTRYGVAPYTSGNTILWEDLRDGKIYDDAVSLTYTTITSRKRPDLMSIIPVNEQGKLRAPNEFLARDSFQTNTDEIWAFSDGSPVETAWRRSSEWPYVVQIVSALLAPAKYGTMMFDTSMFENDSAFDQILQKGKSYRPGVVDFKIHGCIDGSTIKRIEGYNQFIGEFARYNSYSIDDVNTKINNLQLNLCYGIAGFTDKNYLKVVAESVSPSSNSENIFIPDEDLTVYTKKSPPLERVVYSGVQIIKRSSGYEIQGYDIENPFFKIIPSIVSDLSNAHTVGDITFFEYNDFESVVASIPYGTIITSRQQVFDFLVAYQRYLTSRGIVFNESTNGESMDFITTGKEFAFWIQQQWSTGSVFVISPFYQNARVNRAYATVDDISKTGKIKDANGSIINPKYYDVSRNNNLVEIAIDPQQSQLYSVQLDPIQYEHVIVLNNTTIFNDVIFQPELGNRQDRLKLIGSKSGNWDGSLHAPGFFINENTIDIWKNYTDYNKGNFVSYQGKTYVSLVTHTSTNVFEYSNWKIADNIQTGLIKNLANKAGQFNNFFDLDTLNLEDGVDKLGKGTIGFTEKSYLAGLGLDDVSQVKFYQGLLKNKGTSSAINKLITADLTNLNQDINFYEEWAFRVGEYGSIDSNQVVEVIVPEQQAKNNPMVIHLQENEEIPDDATSHYHVKEKDLYKVPNNFSEDLFASRGTTTSTLADLDTAGYVRLEDIDYTVFDDNALSTLSEKIGEIGKGDTIWIGNSNQNTWDVKRVEETLSTIIGVSSTTNGYLVYTTDKNHGLVKDDYVIVNAQRPIGFVDKIVRVDSPNTFAIQISGIDINLLDVTIPMYKLSSMRFAQPSDITSYSPLRGWDNKELVWIDDDATGNWNVLQNTKPWTTTGVKPASNMAVSGKFGKSIAVNPGSTTAVVGAPDIGSGLVLPYIRSTSGALQEGNSVTVSTLNNTVDSFGHALAAGTSYYAVGAPDTESAKGAVFTYYQDQLGQFNLRPSIRPAGLNASDQFGYSLTMSGNGRHLFVGAPGKNTVYAYTIVEIPTISKKVFTVVGASGSATKNYALGFTPISAESLSVVDEGGRVYLPNVDWTLSGSTIQFVANVLENYQIVVRQLDYFTLVNTIAGSGSSSGDKFGNAIDVDDQGRNLIIGAPNATVSSVSNAGEAYVFAQLVQKFAGDGTTTAFTTEATLQTKIFVEVNGVLQVETDNPDIPVDNDGSSSGFYTRSSKTITFKYTPVTGDTIRVYTGSFVEKQIIDQTLVSGDTITEDEKFGDSVAVDSKGTLIAIGSPGEDEINPNTGSVFVFSDSGKNYATITSEATSHSQTAADSIYIDDTLLVVAATGTTASVLASQITDAGISGVSATATGETITIVSTNTEKYNKLTMVPGTGTTFRSGTVVNPFKYIQKLSHPNSFENQNFGTRVAFDKHIHEGTSTYNDTRNLIVSSDRASAMLSVGFDIETDVNKDTYQDATTAFDSGSTTYTDRIVQSGSAYAYELLSSYNETVTNPNKFVFSQQLQSTNQSDLDEFGGAIAYNDNRIFVGAPNDTATATNCGSVYEFNNDTRASGWGIYRQETPDVDVNLINRVVLYNKRTGNIIKFLDHIDGAKGKISGIAQSELDFTAHNDPAIYDNNRWGFTQTNRLWWDISTVHFLDYEQGSINYRTTYWNEKFPNSSVDVYEWIESDVLPSQYTGLGTVKYPDDSRYTVAQVYNQVTNTTEVKYYFWVKGIQTVPQLAEFRNISARNVEQLIEDPKGQGISFVAFVDTDSIALYNCKQFLADSDVVLSVNYDVVENEGILHSEFELYGKGNTNQQVPTRIYKKLIDSLSGSDTVGNLVPDPLLSEVEKHGVLTQPRQSMFINKANALKVLVQYCNKEFAKIPVVRNRSLTNISKGETIPTVNGGQYDTSVDTLSERDFLNTTILPIGYNVLVLEDENNKNYWTIYSLQSNKSWALTTIQSYNTSDYWSYVTYYTTGYDSTTVPKYQVMLESDLLTLSEATVGDVAKVTSNDEGNYSFFEKTDTGWDEVVIENGTIELSDSLYDYNLSNTNFEPTGFDNGGFDFASWDKVPSTEIRNIVTSLKNDIFIDTDSVKFNELFFRLVEYAMSETQYLQDWAFKTSFLTVAHRLRNLDQYSTFKFDNTAFIEDFINDVKPYKSKIREYVSQYDKVDTFQGDATDFDVHAFYDEDLNLFRKPSGDYSGDEIKQEQGLNKPWFENHGYILDSIIIVNAGTGYITDPTVTISAPQLAGGVQATATAKTNSDSIVSITMTNKGSGYTSNPVITITGSGTGITVSPRLVNNTVRGFDTTIKFDRISYASSIKDWTANTSYSLNDIVAYKNTTTNSQEVYTVTASFTSGTTFSIDNTLGVTVMEVYADGDFTTTADRISAYYTPTSGMIGDDLELLQKGTGYLGNKVTGLGFDKEPGFDQSNFDIGGFDNFEIDADGLVVVSGIDTIVQSLYTDLQLGLRPEDINIDGAGFVDTYNSHAPEELVPGRVYDTLDMEVYTHPSNDYAKDGEGAVINYMSFTDDSASQTEFSYGTPGSETDDNVYHIVYKNTQRLYSFTVDYENMNIVLSSTLSASDILHVYSYSTTGEKMSGEYTYTGDGSTSVFVLGNNPELSQQVVVFVNGVDTLDFTLNSQDGRSNITFNTAPSDGAHIHVLVYNQAASRTAPTKFLLQTQSLTAGTYTYALNNTVQYAQSFGANTVVEIDDVRLRPANSKYHAGDGSTVQFAIATTAEETTVVNGSDIGVAIIQQSTNTTLNAVATIDYTVTPGDAYVTMTTVPAEGDIVIVYNNRNAEYIVSADGTEITINTSVGFTSSSVMRVNTFSNHDPLRIQTKVFKGEGTGSTTTIDEFDEIGFDSAGFDRSVVVGTVGSYTLDRTVTNINHFWITLNGVRLHPGDYTTNGSSIVLSENVQASVTGTSIIVVTHFTENTIKPTIGFKIFQDMNGNVDYLRLSKAATTKVAVDVTVTDERIYVDDINKLPYVTPDSEFPGVVFIGSERITYWEVSLEDHYISNLRRGTQGTTLVQTISKGFNVIDGGKDQQLPASDTHTKTWYNTGTGTSADGLGLQQSNTLNALFLKQGEAQVPNYKLELNQSQYIVDGYVEDDYIEELK